MAVTATEAIAVDFLLLAITLILLTLRLYVNLTHYRRLSPSDILIIIAWLCFLANVLVDAFTYRTGFWDPRIVFDGGIPHFEEVIPDPKTIKDILKLMFAAIPFFPIVLYNVKLAFCLWYLQLFPKEMKKLRIALWCTIVLVVGGLLGVILIQVFWCWPIWRNWTDDRKLRCLSWTVNETYFFAIAMTIVTDMLVYTLPFFLLPSILRSPTTSPHSATLRRRRLVHAVVMFALGFLVLACSSGRIASSAAKSDAPLLSVWNAAEQATALIVVCCLPLGWLWRTKVKSASTKSKRILRRRHTCCNCNCERKPTAGEEKRWQERREREEDIESYAKWDDDTEAQTSAGYTTIDFPMGLAPPQTAYRGVSNSRRMSGTVAPIRSLTASSRGSRLLLHPTTLSSYVSIDGDSERGHFTYSPSDVSSNRDKDKRKSMASSNGGGYRDRWRMRISRADTNVTNVTENTVTTNNTFGVGGR